MLNLKKIIYLMITLNSLILSSCVNNDLQISNELSQKECSALIERARKFVITANHLNISPDDKKFVRDNSPRLFITYSGYKRGVAKMVWKLNPSYSIRIICKEDLTDKSGLIRLTVSRFK